MKRYYVSIMCIILACVMCVGLISCSNSKDNGTGNVVTNENGEIVTNKDGSVVTNASDDDVIEDTTKADETTKKENDAKERESTKKEGKKDTTTKKDDAKTTTKKDTTTKKQTTTKKKTTTTLAYTTTKVSPGGAIETLEEPIDPDYLLTGNSALYYMQERYDVKEYVVNLISEDDTNAKLNVYSVKKNKLYSSVTVNLKTGKATETIKETGKKNTFTLGV